MRPSTAKTIAFWTATLLGPSSFVIGGVMGLTQADQAVAGIHRLGYPEYFGVMLGLAKLLGAIAITLPGLPRLKEWAYAGFAITLVSALIAHVAVGDGPKAWSWAAVTFVLWVATNLHERVRTNTSVPLIEMSKHRLSDVLLLV